MEEFVPFVLPYILVADERGLVKGLPWELEVALLFLKIEDELRRKDLSALLFQRLAKKIGMKRPEIVKISLVAKVFCPFWIAPLKAGKGILVDGLGIFRQILKYEELPDAESFIRDLKEAKSFEEYRKVIDKHYFTFLTFKNIRNVVIVGLVPYEDLMSSFQSFLTHCRREEVSNALSLNPNVTREQAVDVVKTLSELEQASMGDLEKLASVKEALLNQTRYWVLQQTDQIKVMQRDRTLTIEKERANIRALIEKLHFGRESKIADAEKTADERIKALEKEQAELLNQLQNLKQQMVDNLRKLEDLKNQRIVLSKDKEAVERRRSETSAKISDLRVRLNFLKEEQLKLENLIATWKGESNELAAMRERLLGIRREIDKINEALLSLDRELQVVETASRDIQISIDQFDRKIESQEKSTVVLDTSIQEKESRLSAISHQIKDIRRSIHEEVLKIDKEYRLLIEEQRKRIDALQTELAKTIATERRFIDELTKKTEHIKLQIENLTKQKSDSLLRLQKMTLSLPSGLNLVSSSLVQFPLYLIGFETSGGIEYELCFPLHFKISRKFPGIKELSFGPVSSSFDTVFKTELLEAMNLNSMLEKEILEGSRVVNLFQSSTAWETLVKGLDELKTMGWISDRLIRQVKVMFADKFHAKRENLGKSEFL
ncbi:hypothetical protein KEJ26_00085 [Candidatus Bathyarchaeota archaeon]|nr:hypothetical protein [Candidatus Bathyarchaeota archaeon]